MLTEAKFPSIEIAVCTAQKTRPKGVEGGGKEVEGGGEDTLEARIADKGGEDGGGEGRSKERRIRNETWEDRMESRTDPHDRSGLYPSTACSNAHLPMLLAQPAARQARRDRKGEKGDVD
jgi:hypothetical protein